MRRALTFTLTLLACAPLIAACGNTLQDQPISNTDLEQLVSVEEAPVYWLGSAFHGLALTSILQDPGGAYTLQYGDCVTGGPASCLTPLEVISSPDNGFVPAAGGGAVEAGAIRGGNAVQAQGGRVLELRTGPIVVDLHARSRRLARAAAAAIVPINAPGQPGAPLPAALPDTGFDRKAMESQRPWSVKLLAPVPPPR